MKLLRTFPSLQTRDIITLTVQFMTELPGRLHEQVVRHPWDDSLVLD
jgi:cell cycle arrest protein BUB2